MDWRQKWRSTIRRTRHPGVWERKEGGFLIRALITERATGRRRELKRVLPNADLETAITTLAQGVKILRDGAAQNATSKTRFAAFAVDVFEQQKRAGRLRSAASLRKWGDILVHLIAGTRDGNGALLVRGLGEFFLDELRPTHLEQWHANVTSNLINTGIYKPTTCTGWRAVLRVVLRHAQRRLALSLNLADSIPVFDTREHDPYPAEEPNALPPERVGEFLAALRTMYPQFYAMTLLGLFTGLRPSSLRPLRRSGEQQDILWDSGEVLVRRSQTFGEKVMNTTKTGVRLRIGLPAFVMDVLRWHVDTQLMEAAQQDSELLFPSITGGFRAPTVLNKPFAAVAQEMRLGYKFTQRGLRRTFQDLARRAEIESVVTRSISGHATEQMREHYSTVAIVEKARAIERMVQAVGVEGLIPGAEKSQDFMVYQRQQFTV